MTEYIGKEPLADRAALFLSDSGSEQTERLSGLARRINLSDPDLPDAAIRAVIVRAGNERDYLFVANFSDKDCRAVLSKPNGKAFTQMKDIIHPSDPMAHQDLNRAIRLSPYGIRLIELPAIETDGLRGSC